jgi:alkanesulfonate monooxygenase SsuD/methylene tetrahydromethanopterin reductase-like flavin-dependent oxidoreductase (luciferase family)
MLRRGLAVPCFAEDPRALIGLGVEAEHAGFDGFFLWDHLVHADSGEGPPIVDPWQVLAVVAANTSRIRIGTLITPVPRRRPWQLAKETTTLDRLSGGRLTLGVGIGSPARGDFGRFHEPTDERVRAELLDEGLEVLAGLWSGERFSMRGRHFTVEEVRFAPRPVQRPRIPVWVGGVLPAPGPVARASRWDGMVPLRLSGGALGRPAPGDIARLRARVEAARGSVAGFDLVVWAEVEQAGGEADGLAPAYEDAGATWWVESVSARPGWWETFTARVARGR